MTNVSVVTRSQLSKACRDALDLAGSVGYQLQAGSVLVAGRVYWTSSGTLRRLIKLGLATPKLELQDSDIVDGRIPFTVLLTAAGISLAQEAETSSGAKEEEEEPATRPATRSIAEQWA